MKFDQLMTSLKQGHYSSVYLLHGEEPYFIDQASGYIAEHCIDEASKDFNQTVMYAADVKDPGMLLETLKRYPMMAERQLVILKEAHQLKADYWEKLESYFNAPQDTTVFVIEHKYKKADARKRWTKAIGKNGVAFQSAKIYDNKLPDWIHNYLADRHYRIGQKGSHLIADFLGNDLSKIANELEKLFISLEPGATVTEEDIETHIGISKDFNIFELQNAIGDRDFAKAIRIARYFGQHQKDHPIFATIPVLLGYFSKLMGIHFARQMNLNRAETASKCSIPPFVLDAYFKASRNYSGAQCAQAISHIRHCDKQVKGVESPSIDQGEALVELLTSIMLN